MSKINGYNIETDWARAPPKTGSAWESFCKAIYNPDDNSCLGRTPKRWAIALMFYAVFYAVLAAMFAVCMAALMKTIDYQRPTFILTSSLIGGNPGVSYRPLSDPNGFLWYDTNNVTDIVASLDEFLQPYHDEHAPFLAAGGGCSKEEGYGFPYAPCIFIKVNKIYGWEPDFYDHSALPEDMPEDLKNRIGSLPPEQQKQVWVSCWEEHNLKEVTFEYPGAIGLPQAAFPYVNNEAYRSPIVAVKIHPEVKTRLTVRCRAWAKNIMYNKSIKEASGYARIMLYVDLDKPQETP